MKYKAVLFDFDGTLADSAEWFLRRMNELADEYGFRRIEEGEYELVRGFSSEEVMKHVGMPRWRLPQMMSRMRQAAARDWAEIRLFPGVGAMLAELEAGGVCLGIVSSNSEGNIRKILGEENAGRFGVWSCGASLFGKATKLRGVLRRGGWAASEVIYVGDEIRDAVAARAVGMAFGAVGWGLTTREALRAQGPTVEFDAMAEIVGKLL